MFDPLIADLHKKVNSVGGNADVLLERAYDKHINGNGGHPPKYSDLREIAIKVLTDALHSCALSNKPPRTQAGRFFRWIGRVL
jgi:hypothetical protein